MNCGRCGLTYIGMTAVSRNGRQTAYYRCNGKHDTRGVYGEMGKRCPSKDVLGQRLEEAVWEEIEGKLRQPEEALARLQQRLACVFTRLNWAAGSMRISRRLSY